MFERLAKNAKKPHPPLRVDNDLPENRSDLPSKHYQVESPNFKEPPEKSPSQRPIKKPKTINLAVPAQLSLPLDQPVFALKPTPINARETPVYAPDHRYRIFCEGLWCRRETDWDHATPSDEYIITLASDARNAQAHPDPHNPDYYEDLDDGNKRVGPQKRVWGGERGRIARNLELLVTVFEQDSGFPEDAANLLMLYGGMAFVACAYTGGVGCLIAVIIGIIAASWDFLSGGDDDLISAETTSLNANDFAEYANSDLQWKGDVPYHFYTRHRGEGADYRVYFTVRRAD